MAEVVRAGVTHIIDMQIEFDDTALAELHGVQVLWNAIDDDFESKPAKCFERGVEFAIAALGISRNKSVHSLRGGRTPGTDDGAGAAVLVKLEAGRGNGVDPDAASGGGFSRCLRAQCRKIFWG